MNDSIKTEYRYGCYIFVLSIKDINMKTFLLVAALLIYGNINAQQVHDFTVTDTDGIVHNIYTDHLDQGQTVVIKVFFVACPPCNAIAPSVQALYEEWGEGEYDVEFIEVTTRSNDDDMDVQTYKNIHGLTFPGISADGDAPAAVDPIKAGDYGPYFGTPSFAVIAPDGTIDYGLSFSQLDAAIAATGATGGNTVEPSTTINISYNHPTGKSLNTEYLTATLHPSGQSTPSYNISQITDGSLSFEYPSAQIPAMNNPTITITTNAPANTGGLSGLDIVKMRKHILGFEELTTPWQLIAADVTGEGNSSSLDIVRLRKVILGFDDEFPNQLSGYAITNAVNSISPSPGNTINLNIEVIKRGDLD